MLSSRNEQGNILLYAVIAVTFLAGLGMYLQKMSDPMLFQTNDTKKLLTAEYLTSSSSRLLSEIIYNDQQFPKYGGTSIGDAEAQFREKFAKIVNRYKSIYLFTNKNSLLASITRKGDFEANQVNTNQDENDIFLDMHAYAKQEYTIRPYTGKEKSEFIAISIKF